MVVTDTRCVCIRRKHIHSERIMPADDRISDAMATLLMALEAAEQVAENRPLLILRRPANLHEREKAELKSDPNDRIANPLVDRIAKAMVQRGAQGA
jgi:hypothetical protein